MPWRLQTHTAHHPTIFPTNIKPPAFEFHQIPPFWELLQFLLPSHSLDLVTLDPGSKTLQICKDFYTFPHLCFCTVALLHDRRRSEIMMNTWRANIFRAARKKHEGTARVNVSSPELGNCAITTSSTTHLLFINKTIVMMMIIRYIFSFSLSSGFLSSSPSFSSVLHLPPHLRRPHPVPHDHRQDCEVGLHLIFILTLNHASLSNPPPTSARQANLRHEIIFLNSLSLFFEMFIL